jgi:hypothetical protein
LDRVPLIKCDESHERVWHRIAGEFDRSSPAIPTYLPSSPSHQRDNAVITASWKGAWKHQRGIEGKGNPKGSTQSVWQTNSVSVFMYIRRYTGVWLVLGVDSEHLTSSVSAAEHVRSWWLSHQCQLARYRYLGATGVSLLRSLSACNQRSRRLACWVRCCDFVPVHDIATDVANHWPTPVHTVPIMIPSGSSL